MTGDEIEEWLKENEEESIVAATCVVVWSVEEPLDEDADSSDDEDDMDSVFESLLRWGRKRQGSLRFKRRHCMIVISVGFLLSLFMH